jgi:hypothetical protein
MFMVAIQANGEIKVVEIVNLFEFILHYNILNWGNNYLNNYLGVKFEELAKNYVNGSKKCKKMNMFTCGQNFFNKL